MVRPFSPTFTPDYANTRILQQILSATDDGSQDTILAILKDLDTKAATDAELQEIARRIGDTVVNPLQYSLQWRWLQAQNRLNVLLADQTFQDRIGEVQAAPTPNTLLDRAKSINDSIQARLGLLGQKLMAASTPVAIASDQSPIPVSGPVTQSQLETELDEKFGDVGQKTMAGSAPVTIASDQAEFPVRQGTRTPALTIAQSWLVALTDLTNFISFLQPNVDAVAAGSIALPSLNFLYGYNGATWDRVRFGRQAAAQSISVATSQLPAAVDTDAGTHSASTLRVAFAAPAPGDIITGSKSNASGTLITLLANHTYRVRIALSATMRLAPGAGATDSFANVGWTPGAGGTAAYTAAELKLSLAPPPALIEGHEDSGNTYVECILYAGTANGTLAVNVGAGLTQWSAAANAELIA